MADTEFATGAAETVKRWASKLWVEMPREIYWGKFMKENDMNAVIEVKRDLEGNPGDQLTFTLLRKLSGAGVSGDEVLEGQEEQMNHFSDTVTLDQVRNAVRLKGRLSERRTAFDQRMSAKNVLKTWLAEYIDDECLTQFTTGTAASRIGLGGGSAARRLPSGWAQRPCSRLGLRSTSTPTASRSSRPAPPRAASSTAG